MLTAAAKLGWHVWRRALRPADSVTGFGGPRLSPSAGSLSGSTHAAPATGPNRPGPQPSEVLPAQPPSKRARAASANDQGGHASQSGRSAGGRPAVAAMPMLAAGQEEPLLDRAGGAAAEPCTLPDTAFDTVDKWLAQTTRPSSSAQVCSGLAGL